MTNRSPSQTIGPFFHEALRWKDGARVTLNETGKRIVLAGRVLDGGGHGVGDALLETWQHGPQGKPPAGSTGGANPNGFGRVETGKDGSFRIEITMPAGDAPFLEVTIFARGLLKHLRTRVYFASEAQARKDPALRNLGDSPRLATLIASAKGEGEYRWDVRLQGEGETVFFAA